MLLCAHHWASDIQAADDRFTDSDQGEIVWHVLTVLHVLQSVKINLSPGENSCVVSHNCYKCCMADEANRTISVRPSKALFPRLKRLAEDLGKSEGQLLVESAIAILEMVETGKTSTPQLVRVARALRESGITFASGGDEEDAHPKAFPSMGHRLSMIGA